MARWAAICGFEGGSMVGWSGAPSVDAASARSGAFGAKCNPSFGSQGATMSPEVAGAVNNFSSGDVFAMYAEIYMKILSLPVNPNTVICGLTQNGISVQASADGSWRGQVSGLGNITGAFTPLPTGVWLRVLCKWWSFPNLGTPIYDEFGTSPWFITGRVAQKARIDIASEDDTILYGSGSIIGANLGVGSISLGAKIGCIPSDSGTYDIRFDDVKTLMAHQLADCYATLPWLNPLDPTKHILDTSGSAFATSRITVAVPRAMGTFDQFTPAGAFGNVDEVPRLFGTPDTVATSTNGNATTYLPTAKADDQVIEAITLRVNALGSAAGQLKLAGVDYPRTFTADTASDDGVTPLVSLFYDTPITAAVFNAIEFGLKDSAASLLTLHNIFLEVLGGTDPAFVPPEVEFPSGGQGEIGGIFWAEFTDRAGGLHIWTHKGRELPDPADYYGGFKEGRVIKGLPIRRALSDRSGQYEGLTFGVRLADEDRAIRAMLSTTATKTFVNCTLVERMIADDDRRALLTPRTVGRGLVRNYSTDSPLFVELHGEDTLAVRFASQSLRDQLPNRTVKVVDFPGAAGTITEAGGSTKPVDAVGKPVPIIYGRMSNVLMQNVVVGQAPGVGSGLEVDTSIVNMGEQGGNANGIGGASTFAVNQWISYGIVAIKAGKQGPFTRISGTMSMSFPAVAHTAYSFEQAAGVDSYRVYCFDGWFNPNTGENSGNTFVRWKAHDNSTVDGFFGHKFGVEFFGPTDGNDALVANVPVYALKDVGYGPCPYVYCGIEVLGGVNYHAFLLAGHAIKEVEEIYVNGTAAEIATLANRAAWKIPGFDGNPLYETRNGRRYAVVYGKVGILGPDTGAGMIPPVDGAVGLAFGVKGIEDVGDGTGALITSALQQYKHAFINWILQTYESGAWLATPVFSDDPTLPQVDEDSFDTAEALALARMPGGYVGAFVIGAAGERTSARDLIARLNLSCDVDAGFNRHCQWMVSMIDERPSALTVGDPIFDTVDIDAETFDTQDEIDQLFNHLPFKWEQDYTGKSGSLGGFFGEDEIINQGAEDEVREEKLSPEVDFFMLRDAAIARDIAERRLARVVEPPRLVKFTVPLIGLNSELGDVILLSHFSGIGPNGWISHPIRIVRMETDPDSLSVYIEGYDLQRFVDFLTEKGTGKYGDWLGSFGLADKAARLNPILARAQIRQRPLLWTRAANPATLLGTIDRTPDATMTTRQPIPRRPQPPRSSGSSAAASSARINLGPTAEEP